MTNKESLEKIARLETELAEVKNKTGDDGAFKPENKQKYWYISGGEIYDDWWNNFSTYESLYSIGNCFPTRQSAEDVIRLLKLIQKARESQDGFVPDWKDETQVKFSLKFRMGDIIIENCHLINTAPIFGFWEDELACEQFIDENSEDLRWFFTEYRR